jgi:porphobilinogen deaminase
VPLAAYACAALASDSPACASSPIRLRALVADLSGQQVVRAEAEADPAQAEQLGLQVAKRMREGGVEALLAAFQ